MNKIEVERAINIVEGALTLFEGELLYELAKGGTGDGVIVEIGTYYGRSTICLGLGIKDANREKVYTIDTGNTGDKLRIINDFLKAFNVEDYVIPILGNSLEVAKTWDKPIRLLFIDGSHYYTDVKADFQSWEPYVVKNGVIVFHDSGTEAGVMKVISEFIKNHEKFKIECDLGNILSVTKLSD